MKPIHIVLEENYESDLVRTQEDVEESDIIKTMHLGKGHEEAVNKKRHSSIIISQA